MPLTVTCSLHFSPEIEVDDIHVHRHVLSPCGCELFGRCLLDEGLLYLNFLCDLIVSVVLTGSSQLFGSRLFRGLSRTFWRVLNANELITRLSVFLQPFFVSFHLLEHLHLLSELVLLLGTRHEPSLLLINLSNCFFDVVNYKLSSHPSHCGVHLVSILFLQLLLLQFLDLFL